MTTTSSAPPSETVASGDEALVELLRLSGRGYTVVRHVLNQLPSGPADRTSVLGPMVTERKRRPLQLYLLLLTVWPWLQNQQPLPNIVWARALTTDTGRIWTATNVSEAWNDLEERGLITRERKSRAVLITPRREDGKAPYTPPGAIKKNHRETFFILPGTFWRDGWFEKLSMPGLAMLLIIAGLTSDKQEAWLTNKDAGKWFGLSPRSVEAGIEDLRTKHLLEERAEWIKAPLSAIGATQRHWYHLTGEFDTDQRRALQERTRQEVRARMSASGAQKASGSTIKIKKKGAATGATADRKVKRRRKSAEES
ncbi:hypothetical protein [Nakamurella multipartita]|uniref:Uncharacterized protein n=1 Tax=Nakamurella multipartita (strain ATCC 700099 / DSM 44233 / CIP 104796 / JCM 9543 / NBRC 105858 / Y-104) TaxID=479431 RepID=C8XG36_NAKMY|nr:hypothetical protein [Nakamurella multipartita]ACV80038.1 hypothetical protein Namu_3738 [Nakamurella multipartita DSM 44233]